MKTITGRTTPGDRSPEEPADPDREFPSPYRQWQQQSERFLPWIGLVALCLAFFLPGFFTLPALDRDEARFAQASRQMLETGDGIHIRFQDTSRDKKPIGIYWLQAAAASLAGGSDAPIWAYRLPSLMGAIAAVLLLYEFTAQLTDRRSGFIAASLLGSSLLLTLEAHQAKTDAVLLATILACQGSAALLYCAARWRRPIYAGPLAFLFWSALAIGILVKGPVAPMIVALTIGSLIIADRDAAWLRQLKPLTGLALLALIVVPWPLLLARSDPGFFVRAISTDLLPKLIGAQESHGAPPLYYMLGTFLFFLPGSLVMIPALRSAFAFRQSPVERFCLAWIVPNLIVFELIPTKLPHYVLPLYPALAILAAVWLVRNVDGTAVCNRFSRIEKHVASIGFGLAAFLAGAAALALPLWLHQPFKPIAILAVAAFFVGSGSAVREFWLGQAMRAVSTAIIVAAILFSVIFQVILPELQPLWSSLAAKHLIRTEAPRARAVYIAGATEPSLIFELGTATLFSDAITAAKALQTSQSIALIERAEIPRFTAAAATLGLFPVALGQIDGFNYAGGHAITLTLYAARRADVTGVAK